MEILLAALLGVACTYIAMTEVHKRNVKAEKAAERKEMTEQERNELERRMKHMAGIMDYDVKKAYGKGGGK